jgi:methionyl-tRNA formyltransferase
LRLLFAGTPEVALPSLRALIEHDHHDVVAVLTRPDAPSGRGRSLKPSPVAELAREHGIEVLAPNRPTDEDFLSRARQLDIDCAPVVAYGNLLREPALSLPKHGWVNLHFSLLPAWRGAAPVQHSILHGDEMTGASTFLIGPGLDDGPVFGLMTETIKPTDTSGDLLARLAAAGAGLLVATLDGIETGRLDPKPQSLDGVSLAPKLTTEDARIRFADPALAVDRRIRACTPTPGAWTTFRDERLRLGPVHLPPDPTAPDVPVLQPGCLAVQKSAVWVGTASSAIRLGDVQPAGKRMMAAADWARGNRVTEDDRLG